jgi:hypothetical protein
LLPSVTSRLAAVTPLDCIADPEVLRGKTFETVLATLTWDDTWREERLKRGSRAGTGWVLRQYDADGLPSGRMVRWHPGGGHHGPEPYWRTTSPELGRSEAIPAVEPSDTITL